jgi:hypothetical protein
VPPAIDSGRQLELFNEAPAAAQRAQADLIVLNKSRRSSGQARLTLAEAARIMREAVKDKSYRATPVGRVIVTRPVLGVQ